MLRTACLAALALFAALAAPAQAAPPSNDNFANAIALPPAPLPMAGNTTEATRESGEPDHTDDGTSHPDRGSLWYRWTAPASATVQFDTCTTNYDTHLGVYTGTAVNALTPVGRNNNAGCPSSGTYGSRVVFNARRGVVYRIAVDGCCGLPKGNFTLSFTSPGNAMFEQREVLTGAAPSVISQLGGPDPNEAGEPAEPGGGDRSVWYAWTAPTNGSATILTCGQSSTVSNTHLGVYTGTSVSALTPVAINDDTPGCVIASGNHRGSSVTFDTIAGTTYQIRVGRGGTAVDFRLRINPTALPHDELAGARQLRGNSPAADESTAGASHETAEPFAPVPFSGGSLWYRWTAPFGGQATSVDTCSSAVPTRLRVFTGTTFANLQPAGTSNDAACPSGSRVTLTPTAGSSYLVQADNETADQGRVQVNWSPQTYITDAPPSSVSARDVQFHFDAHDATNSDGDRMAYACSLDGAAFRTCNSPETYRGLAPGSHSFAVRAIDAAGAVDPSPAAAQFTTTAAASAAGPPGPAGPTGPPGRDGELVVAIAPAKLKSASGKRLKVPYVSTADGRAVLEVVKGRKVVARVRRGAKRGRNTIVWNGKRGRKKAKPGRYTARLSVSAGGATARDSVPLKVVRAKKRR